MKGGVLIIGSLLWDNDKESNHNYRDIWRTETLDMKAMLHVFAPIRYGRKSSSRKSHTMVFSHEIDVDGNLGQAYVVPFIKQDLSVDDVILQAKKLSKVEGLKDDKLVKGGPKEKWCIIGILFNPEIDESKKNALLLTFGQQLNEDGIGDHYKHFKVGDELAILNEQGELQIAWIRPVEEGNSNKVNSLDFVLAACTKPNVGVYPDPSSIADLVLQDLEDKYFYNNHQNGIITFQDSEIMTILKTQ